MFRKYLSLKHKIFSVFFFVLLFGAYLVSYASIYAPGGTLDPDCAPTAANCTVTPISIGGTINSATLGSVMFAGTSGVLAQDNSNFFWDDTNNRLGIGTASPSALFSVGSTSQFQVNSSGVATIPSMTTNTSGFSMTRQEATPSAPTAALVTDGTGNCTAGTHVFAVVFNTIGGHTDTSAISNSVTCDGTHTKVYVTIPEAKMYVLSRDIYASKAGTTSPLYLVSTSPMITWPIANSDNARTSIYTFNTADASLTATTAPTSNTAVDPAYSFGSNGQISFGSGSSLQSISSSVAFQFNESGSTNLGMFQRMDEGEARFTIISGGVPTPTTFNYPELMLINPGITIGANNAVSYTPLQASSRIASMHVMGSKTSAGDFSCSNCTGFEWVTTENWSNSGQGLKMEVHLNATGTPAQTDFIPLSIDSINGSIFTGTTSDSTTYSIKVRDSSSASLFSIRNDGKIGIGTATPSYRLDINQDSASTYATRIFHDGNATTRWGLLIQAGLDDSTAVGPSTLIAFQDGDGGAIGSITFGSSATAYNTTSDSRLKNLINENTTIGLEKLNQIKIHDFSWKADSNNTLYTGVFAQELYDIYPMAVTKPVDENTDNWMVDYSKLTPVVVQAIQEMDIKVEGIQNFAEDSTFAGNLRAWLANATNHITRIFTGEICLTDADGSSECLNKTELHDLKQLLNQTTSSSTSTSSPDNSTPTTQSDTTQQTSETDNASDAVVPSEESITPPVTDSTTSSTTSEATPTE